MTKDKDLKDIIRARMAKTGESYAAARKNVLGKGIDGLSQGHQPGAGPQGGTRYITVYCDYETSTRAGADGMFQVIDLTEGGEDVTHLVDQGVHWSSLRELERYLAKATGGDIMLDEALDLCPASATIPAPAGSK
jgi:hypothetical protein